MPTDQLLLSNLLLLARAQPTPAGACLYHAGQASTSVFWLAHGRVELAAPTGVARIVSGPALLGTELLAEPVCRHTARLLDVAADVRSISLVDLRARWQADATFRLHLLHLMSCQTGKGE